MEEHDNISQEAATTSNSNANLDQTPIATRTTISSGFGSDETLDPKKLSIEQMKFIRYKFVRIEVKLNQRGTSLLTVDGVCQSIDPMTRSIILLHPDGDSQKSDQSTMEGLTILPGELIQSIQIVDKSVGESQNSHTIVEKVHSTIDKLRGCSSRPCHMGTQELIEKKNQIKEWLGKNRIPVRESQVVEYESKSTSTSVSFEMLPTLFIAGSCTLQAPYTCDNLLCPNEIMFAKLRNLIQSIQ